MDLEKIYEYYDEDTRLNRTKAHGIEFLTIISFIDKYWKNGMKIIDIGAGTGANSLYYANKGY